MGTRTARFILTIWNVNCLGGIFIIKTSSCFILTIWNVN
ncbi:putative membrane protein [Clostridioides difficile P51]|nr:putative membrane protein [Clostridioides difficile P51]